MSARISLMAAVWFAALLGCSTAIAPVPKVAAAPAPRVIAGALTVSTQPAYPSVPPFDPKQGLPKVCQLGTTCLTMDPRPFEVCFLSAKSCGDKLAESMLVAQTNFIETPEKSR
jgi:hypothetical protein